MEARYVNTKSKKDRKIELKTPDPQNLTWAKNDNRFGVKMLQKMGWKEGKGLGANEDGMTDHIRIKKKDDNSGIGADQPGAKVWTNASAQFSDILKNLSQAYAAKSLDADVSVTTVKTEETTVITETIVEEPPASDAAEPKPKKVKHKYNKIWRSKTVSNYNAEDLSAIFGKHPHTPALIEKVEEVKDEHQKEATDANGLITHTSNTSLNDYFKQKMAELRKRKQEENGNDVIEHQHPEEEVQEQQGEELKQIDRKRAKKERKEKRRQEKREQRKQNKEKSDSSS